MTSPTLRHWLRGQPCALRAWMFCAGPAVELHHYPTRGALGAPVDLLALPVCRACHDACHRPPEKRSQPQERTMKRTGAPIALELFAGAGGLSEGLESAGIKVAVATELHPQPALTHAFNHPNTGVIFGDIRSISTELLSDLLERRAGTRRPDIVVGGPPCQGFSTAGKKVSTDPRNSLFHQFVRVVGAFLPSMFLMENVPGFKKLHGGFAFAEASRLFTELGYELMDTVVDASGFGVPQRRQRFVMIGWLPKEVRTFAWPATTHEEGLPLLARTKAPLTTVEHALSDLSFLKPGWEAHHHQAGAASEYQAQRRNGCALVFNHLASRHRARAMEMFSFIREGQTISSVPAEVRSAKRTMARLDRHRISNAVLALPDDLIHYEHDRIPTVREMARLQTFDDDYVFIGKRTSGFVERRVDVPQYTQVGNAVPPLLARALGQAVCRAFGGSPADLRDIDQRRERHAWVRGSSGFAGYTLDPAAEGKIAIFQANGASFSLPISTQDTPVTEAEPLFEWKTNATPQRRGQWAPGVRERTVPAHMAEPEEGAEGPREVPKQEAEWLARELVAWFHSHRRDFPWREPGCPPFTILLAELFLQQTTAERVCRFLPTFLVRFPNALALAESSEETLASALAPLGLQNRRAKTLRALGAHLDGCDLRRLTRDDWLALPGVGPYVAAAMLCALHDAPEPMLDVNEARVFDRYAGPRLVVDLRRDRWLAETARRVVGAGPPRLVNWALFDLAALVCTSRKPTCDECPLRSRCAASTSR